MSVRIALSGVALAAVLAPSLALACSGALHIEIEEAGVYALDHEAILASQPGLAGCPLEHLALSNRGQPVPMRVAGPGPTLAEGARIEWLGERLHGPMSWFDGYSVENVYILAAGAPGSTPARLEEVPGATAPGAPLRRRIHQEQENLMIRLDQHLQKPGEEPDVWMWAKLTHVDPEPFAVDFDLPDLDTRETVQLRLNFRGLSRLPAALREGENANPDLREHAVEVRINGRPLTQLAWDGREESLHTVEVDSGLLRADANRLQLSIPARKASADSGELIDVVMFNWLEADYPIRGRLDASRLPLRATGGAGSGVVLHWQGEGEPVLFGSDGTRRSGRALGGGRFGFAGAGPGTVLQPVAGAGSVRAPLRLRRVGGGQWQDPQQGYDYLIVSHATLMDAIEPLAEFHRSTGLSVAVLDVADVYDQFHHGIVHPRAIRNLVKAAWNDWPSRPRFLLLVGDASFDIRHESYNNAAYAKFANRELEIPGQFGTIPGGMYPDPPERMADRNLIPTWQFPSSEGQSASDNWFVAIEEDSWHPLLAVGRMPVVKPAEVTAIVDKTLRYIREPQLGSWKRDVMFITDEIQSFKHASDRLASRIAADGFGADKVYADPERTDNALQQDAIRKGIDEGRLLVHFIGHGGRYIWRTGPPDPSNNQDLFTLDDVSGLGNADRLPMVLSMTCYSAPFDNPSEDSIGERFLREPDKGAVAVFAASWRNAPLPSFSEAIIRELLTPGAPVGEAILRAKRETKDRTMVEMYNLLGDPALVLSRPADEARVAPDGDRWAPAIAVDLGGRGFSGNVRVEWRDDKGNELARSEFHTTTQRFRVPVPVAAREGAATVQVYAASPLSGRDSVGAVDLKATGTAGPSPRERLVAWWREFTRPAYQPPTWHADTINILDFDTTAAHPGLAAPQVQAATAASAAD